MPKSAKYIIHVNQHKIRANIKNKNPEPPITIKKGKGKNIGHAYSVKVKGDCELIYDPHKPLLSCGARLILVCDDFEIIE